MNTAIRVPAQIKEKGVIDGFRAYAEFMVYYAQFGEIEKKIMASFKIEAIIDPTFWNQIISQGETPKMRQLVLPVRYGLDLITEHLPSLIDLLKRDAETKEIVLEEHGKKGKTKTAPTQRITFLIREPDAPTLTADQFVNVLQSVQNLYDVILKVDKLDHSELIVGSLDFR